MIHSQKSEMRTVLVCDDHPLFRKGVSISIEESPNLNVIGEASNGKSCIAKLQLFTPDILVTDLSMPGMDGFEVLMWAQNHQPDLKVFILSMHSEVHYLQKAIELGAAGFLAKEDAQSELIAAINHSDDGFYSSESIGASTESNLTSMRDHAFESILRKVSDAERRVLVLLTESLTSKQIAEQLNISARTVDAHRANLAEKLDAKGPNKLLEIAIKFRNEIRGS